MVEEIIDSRMFHRRLQYLVKWEGYGLEANTWEDSRNVANAPEKVAEFHTTHPAAPRRIRAMAFGSIPFHLIPIATFALSRCLSGEGGDCKGNPFPTRFRRLHRLRCSAPTLQRPLYSTTPPPSATVTWLPIKPNFMSAAARPIRHDFTSAATCICQYHVSIIVLDLPYCINVYGQNPTTQKTMKTRVLPGCRGWLGLVIGSFG